MSPRGHGARCLTAAGCAAAVLVAVAVIYTPGLHAPLVLDDFEQLVPLQHAIAEARAGHRWLLSTSGPLGRPLAMASFVVDARVHGADWAGWRLTNLALHLLTGVLLGLLGVRAARLLGERAATGGGLGIGLAAAALWLVHPLQVSTVLYTVQRMTILAALLSAAALLAFVHGRWLEVHQAGHPWRWQLAAFGVLWPLALLAKESAALVPLLAWVITWSGPPGRWRRRWLWALGVAAALVLAGGLMWCYGPTLAGMEPSYAARGYGVWQRLLTEARVVALYALEVLAPLPGTLGFMHDDVTVSRGLLDPPATAIGAGVVVALAVAAVAVRRRAPLVAAGLGLFLAGHLLEGTVVPLELMFEHRNYLPSWGLILALVAAVAALPLGAGGRTVVAVAAALALGAMTAGRVALWGDELALYQSWYRHHPRSDRAVAALAGRWIELGDAPRARALLRRHGSPAAALQALYLDCRIAGAADPARLAEVARASASVEVESYLVGAASALAGEVLDGRCALSAEAVSALVDALLARPIADRVDRYKLLVYRAHLVHHEGDLQAALDTLERAVALRPRDPVPLFLAAEWLIDADDRVRAATYYRRAVKRAQAEPERYRGYVTRVAARLAKAGDRTEGAWTPVP